MEWSRDGAALTLHFEAEDPIQRAEWDARNATPTAVRIWTHHVVVYVTAGCALLACSFIGYLLVERGVFGAQTGVLFLFVGGLLARWIVRNKLRDWVPAARIERRDPALVTSSFTLRITPSTFTLLIDGRVFREMSLAEIADVTGGEQVRLVQRSGGSITLPITRYGVVNDEMAEAIRRAIREQHALTADYRGRALP